MVVHLIRLMLGCLAGQRTNASCSFRLVLPAGSLVVLLLILAGGVASASRQLVDLAAAVGGRTAAEGEQSISILGFWNERGEHEEQQHEGGGMEVDLHSDSRILALGRPFGCLSNCSLELHLSAHMPHQVSLHLQRCSFIAFLMH